MFFETLLQPTFTVGARKPERPRRLGRVFSTFSLVACAALGCESNGAGPQPVPSSAAAAPSMAAPKLIAPSGAAALADLYKVPLGDSPTRGGSNAKVTLVVFSEFECPFCAKAKPTLDELATRYGDDLKIVWKHLPLPFHARAVPAALAAEAARSQGQFWPMHDRIFGQATALGAADLESHARALGLDLARWTAALNDPALKARVDADRKLAETLGVRGTPTFFVNGRKIVGAQPVDRFVAIIDEEAERADVKLRAGVDRAQLYAALTQGGLDKAPAGEPPAAAPPHCQGPGCAARKAPSKSDPAQDTTIHPIEIGASPTRGPAGAPITLVLFSDFECPFCKKIEGTIKEIEAAYPGKIRVVWKNFPLAFHAGARGAAIAAMTAHEAGKFWPMHDRLLERQDALDAATIEAHARDMGRRCALEGRARAYRARSCGRR